MATIHRDANFQQVVRTLPQEHLNPITPVVISVVAYIKLPAPAPETLASTASPQKPSPPSSEHISKPYHPHHQPHLTSPSPKDLRCGNGTLRLAKTLGQEDEPYGQKSYLDQFVTFPNQDSLED